MASWSYLFPGRFLGSSAIAASPPEGTRTFPVPIESYRNEGINSTVGKLVNRVRVEPLDLVAALVFVCVIIYTFLGPESP